MPGVTTERRSIAVQIIIGTGRSVQVVVRVFMGTVASRPAIFRITVCGVIRSLTRNAPTRLVTFLPFMAV